MYKRTVLEKMNWDNANYKHGEDFFCTTQILNFATSVVFIDEFLYHYREDRLGKLTDSSFNIHPDGSISGNCDYIKTLLDLLEVTCASNHFCLNEEINSLGKRLLEKFG
jgi:hypothetical protein